MITNQNFRQIIPKIRNQFIINRCYGLYQWLTSFDLLLLEKQYRECWELLREIQNGGYHLLVHEQQAVEERECALRFHRNGAIALTEIYKEKTKQLDPDIESAWLADAFFRLGLLYQYQANVTEAQEYFQKSKQIADQLNDTKRIGRAIRILTALEGDPETVQEVFKMLWQEYIAIGRRPIEIITGFIDEPNWRVRREAIAALAEIGAINELGQTLLTHPDIRTRLETVLALAKIPDLKVSEYLKEALKDSYWLIRWQAVKAFETIKDPEGTAILLPNLSDPDIEVRIAVVEALGKLAGREAIPYLEQVIAEPEMYDTLDQSLRHKARNAINEIKEGIAR